MTFQSTVYADQGAGVVGELYLDGPLRAQPGIIDSTGTTPAFNRVGRAFTQVADADGHCIVGGDPTADGTPFYGILANPKEQALYGTLAGGTLAPSLDVPQYGVGSFVQMGELWGAFAAACQVGDLVDFVIATGVLVSRAPSVANPVSGNANIPGAAISRFNLTGAGITVVKLTG